MPEINLPGTVGELTQAAWAAYRNGDITIISDAHSPIAIISPMFSMKSRTRIINVIEADRIGDIIRACQRHARLRYYPNGAEVSTGQDNPLVVTAVMRAVTHNGGGFAREDEDIRDLYVWTSGTFEHWYPISDLVNALSNMDGHLGLSEPMATIDWNNS